MPKKYKHEKQGFIYCEAAHGPLVTFALTNGKVVPLMFTIPMAAIHTQHTSTSTTTTLDTAAPLPPSTTTNSTPTTSYMLDNAAKHRKQATSGPKRQQLSFGPGNVFNVLFSTN
jgi:hypothetical protein